MSKMTIKDIVRKTAIDQNCPEQFIDQIVDEGNKLFQLQEIGPMHLKRRPTSIQALGKFGKIQDYVKDSIHAIPSNKHISKRQRNMMKACEDGDMESYRRYRDED